MIIFKQTYEELIESRDYYKRLASQWEGLAQQGLKTAEEIANTRDKYIEECKELAKRNIPMTVIIKLYQTNTEYWCPNCNKFLGFKNNTHKNFCSECGQALKYKEEI